jgi:chromosome segregation ATPase
MEHSEYRHFLSQAREEIDVVVVPTGGHDGMGCMPNQLKLTPALNEELDQAMKDIRQFGNQGAEFSRRIAELESLYKQHEEAIEKLKQENATLKLGIQSLNELILEIATETRLNGMGEDDNENNNNEDDDDDDGGDASVLPTAAPPPATTPPTNAAPELVVEEEEDSEMLISE